MGGVTRNPVRFKETSLSQSISFVICFCMLARLMPVTPRFDVTKDKAILLYALGIGFSVDMGKVIFHSIRHAHRGFTTSGLRYAPLITKLCRSARVKIGGQEKRVLPKSIY